ncbi:MAG: metal-dependent hydrolase [Thermoanaerobacteraceae bacterium]|nr:metal-dependent hydrolase [Thermoanaerobacteraceae bacterium]
MLWRSHFLAGASLGVWLAAGSKPETLALVAGVAGAAALLPDIDSPRSYIGSRVPASVGVKLVAGHRGVFHSLLAAAVFGLALFLYLRFRAGAYTFLALPFAAGYVSHLLLDALTPEGVPFLWPLKLRFGFPLVGTGGFIERWVVIPALLVLFCFLLYRAGYSNLLVGK